MRAKLRDVTRLSWLVGGNPERRRYIVSETNAVVKGATARGALGRVKWAWGERRNELAMTGFRITVGLLWVNSAWGKISGGTFVGGFAKTNAGFAAKTPFGFYKDFLNGFVIPNADWFAYFLMYGELLTGIALVAGILTNIGAIAGFFMNLNFWLASGYAGGGTGAANIAMGAAAVMFLLTPAAKWLSVDRYLAERLLKGLAAKHPKVTRMFIGRTVTT